MLVKLMGIILVAALAGLFLLRDADDKPLFTFEEVLPSFNPVSSSVKPVIIYKWQDEDGIWQFSNQSVDDVAGVETLELSGHINTIPAFTLPVASLDSERIAAKNVKPDVEIPTGLTSVAPEKIAEMMDTVNNLQKTVDTRKKNLDAITGN